MFILRAIVGSFIIYFNFLMNEAFATKVRTHLLDNEQVFLSVVVTVVVVVVLNSRC